MKLSHGWRGRNQAFSFTLSGSVIGTNGGGEAIWMGESMLLTQ